MSPKRLNKDWGGSGRPFSLANRPAGANPAGFFFAPAKHTTAGSARPSSAPPTIYGFTDFPFGGEVNTIAVPHHSAPPFRNALARSLLADCLLRSGGAGHAGSGFVG